MNTVTLDAPSASDTEITITAPDLASLSGQIAEGDGEFVTFVTVGPDTNAAGGFVDSEPTVASGFGFELPQVSSVVASDTGESSGSILGGYELTITGTGFKGVTRVLFSDGLGLAQTVTLDAPSSSDTEITITAPDLASLAGQIPDGESGLDADVQVGIPDVNAEIGFVESATSVGSEFTFELPTVTSVVATGTGDSSGSIAVAMS